MQSPWSFVVRPINGNRYVNEKNIAGVDFIVNTSEENHNASNREAEVVELPIGYTGKIRKGDTLLVHHNVFKYYNDMYGRKKSGKSFLKDDLFLVDGDQFFMYKQDGQWNAHDKYCFIKPIKKFNRVIDSLDKEEPNMGQITHPNRYLLSKGVKVGDIVAHKPDCNYEFNVDGEKLYRLYDHQISMVL